MSRSIGVKVLAVLLAAVSLVVAVGSTVAFVWLSRENLYTETPEDRMEEALEDMATEVGFYAVDRYNVIHLAKGPEEVLNPEDDRFYQGSFYIPTSLLQAGTAAYVLKSDSGKVLEDISFPSDKVYDKTFSYTMTISSQYPVIAEVESEEWKYWESVKDGKWTYVDSDSESEQVTVPQITTESMIWESEVLHNGYWSGITNDHPGYGVYYLQGPEYEVNVTLLPEAWNYGDTSYWDLLNLLYRYRYAFVAGILLSVLIFVLCLVYLGFYIGRKNGRQDAVLVGLNRLPLDLYTAGAVALGVLLAVCIIFILEEWCLYGKEINYAACTLAAVGCFGLALLGLLLYCCFAAQLKMGRGYWWRHALLGRVLLLLWKALRWFVRSLGALFALLPFVWQWVLTALGMFIILFIGAVLTWDSPVPLFFAILLCAAIVGYGTYAFGTLAKAVRKMAQGDLQHKVPVQYLFGSFRTMGTQLNTLADAAMTAAQKSIQSERMKTELITNVSHDIKTPLTSIINFVDLLQRTEVPEEREQYLTVLANQSQRLKRLIEDLMDLSKANSRNMTTNIVKLDAVEVVNQALGEFADKLSEVALLPILQSPEQPAWIYADGRLTWRVLSNLLSNAVKYALPGTRLYVDVVVLQGRVLISMKNISREQLSVNAEELMERFVRGDASRNTEGNGLGLNIARSLMEVQQGKLQLLVDGDLFKVTLLFPSAE